MLYKEILCILLMPLDYQNTIIYKIVSKDLNVKECYVGHTTNFNRRKQCHKNRCYNTKHSSYNFKVYKFIRENGGWDEFDIVIVEKFSCNDKNEACQRERFWYEQLNSKLNVFIPYQTDIENKENISEKCKQYRKKNIEAIAERRKKYYENNKENFLEKCKQYRKENIEAIAERKQIYYENNKERIKLRNEIKTTCECGKQYTLCHRLRHNKSKKTSRIY